MRRKYYISCNYINDLFYVIIIGSFVYIYGIFWDLMYLYLEIKYYKLVVCCSICLINCLSVS